MSGQEAVPKPPAHFHSSLRLSIACDPTGRKSLPSCLHLSLSSSLLCFIRIFHCLLAPDSCPYITNYANQLQLPLRTVVNLPPETTQYIQQRRTTTRIIPPSIPHHLHGPMDPDTQDRPWIFPIFLSTFHFSRNPNPSNPTRLVKLYHCRRPHWLMAKVCPRSTSFEQKGSSIRGHQARPGARRPPSPFPAWQP